MEAFERDTHKAYRSVMIEKTAIKNIADINEYNLHKYDTVEVIQGNKKTVGTLREYGFRGGSKLKKVECQKSQYFDETVIIGYSSISLYVGHRYACVSYFRDNVRENIFTYMHPCRIVLIEKNVIDRQEKWEEEWDRTHPSPIMGG